MIAGRYELLRELGRGASGVVWLARDDVLGRQVATKRLPRVGEDPHAEVRAWREARVAAGLRHPSLVAVYDLVEDGDDLWLVMEYVEGPSLSGLVAAHGPLDPGRVAPIAGAVADGLALAHAEGIVHRDVKPSNILLGPDGAAKLADFGIARSEATSTLTQTGMVRGSPAYLAPEVATGQGAGPASDVWSLGATLFHALEGHPPYRDPDDNVVATLYRIVHDPVPRTDRGGWLGPLVAGTMTRDLDQRWTLPQVQAFLAAGPPGGRATQATRPIAPVLASPEPPTSVLPPQRRSAPAPRLRGRATWALVLAACLLVAIVVAGVAHLLGGGGGSGDDSARAAERSTAPSTTPPAAPDDQHATPPGGPAAAGPSAVGVRDFVASYLRSAPSSPPSGFRMLTPRYQAASGGLAGYEAFWGEVSRIRSVSPVTVRLDPLEATYTYTYDRQHHGTVTETITLQLVYQGGRYLIDGATSEGD